MIKAGFNPFFIRAVLLTDSLTEATMLADTAVSIPSLSGQYF